MNWPDGGCGHTIAPIFQQGWRGQSMATSGLSEGSMGTSEWPLTGGDAVSRQTLKALRHRRNAPGLIYLAVHVLALIGTGLLVHMSLGRWYVVPAMLAHGTVIVLLFAPLHECSHFTAFRSRWLNYAVGLFAAVATMRPFFYFKWRHAEHHTFTQSPDRDPDLVPLPASLAHYARLVLGLEFWPKVIGTLWRGTTGRFSARELQFIPASDLSRVSLEIRLTVLLYLAVAAASVMAQSWIAVLYWLLPRFLGEPVLRAIRIAEHAGAEQSPNLLRNTRTTLANPILRQLYWNMPFHAEHHLASSVPFHALGRLHAQLHPRLAVVASGYWEVHGGILRHVLLQRRARRAAAS